MILRFSVDLRNIKFEYNCIIKLKPKNCIIAILNSLKHKCIFGNLVWYMSIEARICSTVAGMYPGGCIVVVRTVRRRPLPPSKKSEHVLRNIMKGMIPTVCLFHKESLFSQIMHLNPS